MVTWMIGILLGDRQVRNLGFPEADVKSEQLHGVRKAICDALQSLPCLGDEGSIVHKDKVPAQPLIGLGVD